ncbi:syndetin isoform X2 [Exaiptasia diaphana]|uniref:Syndetin n=1 Tax=Exaiptasia diaphana TaxID=2652724 RepID=A0A913X4G2_EXADI|nr:syndetin isoform X2 [Exaiptasia diaphana]KXJ15287.1 Syndetin [Exaiptasia diaphana]
MALRNRFRSFLGLDRSDKDFPDSELSDGPSESIFKEDSSREFDDDPRTDDEVLETIEEIYFSDAKSFDPSEYELKKTTEKDLVLEDVEEYRNTLRQQLQSVSKKLYTKVLENHSAYVQELQRVMELQESLQNASSICERGRRHLDKARRGVSVGGLGILAKHRKKQHLISLLDSLRTIKTLQRTDVRLKEMLEEEDYPGAITLCLECEKAARAFKHYQCISELSSNLQETLIDIEKQLDIALVRICNEFDPAYYERLQTGYRYLGKTQISMDQLIIHFMNHINQVSFSALLDHVEDDNSEYIADDGLQHVHFGELCKKVTVEHYTPCLLDLCKALWEVMLNYHKVICWHEQYDPAMHVSTSEASNENKDDEKTAEATYNRNYIRQKLDHGLNRIWKEVQERIKTHLLSTDLSYFKYDDFIYVLDLVNRLIVVGEEFCGSKSEDLNESIRKQTVKYFKNYHRSRMDELRMFLENEAWQLCPVKASFKIIDLQEFRFMKQKQTPLIKTHRRTASGNMHTVTGTGFFSRYATQGNPFDDVYIEDEGEDVMAQNGIEGDIDKRRDDDDDEDEDDEDIPDELKLDYVDERTGEVPDGRSEGYLQSRKHQKFLSRVPCITNTTLNVLRVFGKYMQMMNVLKPIAFDVVICMSQLFDYYLFAVTSFFSPEVLVDGSAHGLSIKLRTTLKRISDNLIMKSDPDLAIDSTADDMKVPYPHLSPMVDLSADSMFGLSERILATESLIFLGKQFEYLQSHLDAVIPSNKRAFLSQFYSQTITTVQEIRKPTYRAVASRIIDYEKTLHLMQGVRWDIKDIMSQHNAYVDILVREFQVFSLKMSQLSKRIPVPKDAYNVLWDHCIRLANRTFVEGFASTKKCSNEGRALMQLDFQQYLMKLENLTDIRPIPDREYVETYIKAFYLTENEMERWIREHKEYSSKHVTSLVTCGVGSHITKKGRQKLLSVIEEIDKSKQR